MSADKVDTIVKVDVVRCDICGEIIPKEELDDEEQHGKVLGAIYGKPNAPAAVDTKVMHAKWPGFNFRARFVKEREEAGLKPPHGHYAGEMADRDWDFHGLCLVKLVDAAISLRTNPPEPPKPVDRDELVRMAMTEINPKSLAQGVGANKAIDVLMDEYEIRRKP